MSFDQEAKDKIVAWLDKHKVACSVCGSKDWKISTLQATVSVPYPKPESITINAPQASAFQLAAFVPISCAQCGLMISVELSAIGL